METNLEKMDRKQLLKILDLILEKENLVQIIIQAYETAETKEQEEKILARIEEAKLYIN